jgi:hypothetical protein
MKTCTPRWTVIFTLFLAINTPAMVRYVNVNSLGPTPPCTSWAAAAATKKGSEKGVSPNNLQHLLKVGLFWAGRILIS